MQYLDFFNHKSLVKLENIVLNLLIHIHVLCSHMSTWLWLVSIEMSIKIENIQMRRTLFGFCYGWDGTQTKRLVLCADKLYHRKYCEVWPVDIVAVCTWMNRNILNLPYVYYYLLAYYGPLLRCLIYVLSILFIIFWFCVCVCVRALSSHIDIFTILFFELENIGQFYLIRENKIITRKRII